MDMIGRIRRLHLRDNLSEREIARMTGLSRNTVSKWLRAPGTELPKYRRDPRPNKLSSFESALSIACCVCDCPVRRSTPLRLSRL